MRQYRGKTLDGEWVKGDLITEKGTNGVIKRAFIHLRLSPIEFNGDSLSSRIVLHEVDPKTVGQYVKIDAGSNRTIECFEGDILKTDDRTKEWRIHEVRFKDGGFCGYNDKKHCKYTYIDSLLRNHKVEVIGNIHDNPELLGEGME